MRRKLVAGNWKMNGDRASLIELDGIAAAAARLPQVDVGIALPATLIALAAERVPGLPIGAEDVHTNDQGAHTGEISASMMRDVGARFTIVGHSERRADQHEHDLQVKQKAEAAHRQGLAVILCVGETLEERDAGRAAEVVTAMVAESLPDSAASDWLSIAYEPVWAIGTGRTPTTAEVGAMHGAVRAELRRTIGADADKMRVLYGGSVTAANAAELLSVADVDGALVGGASLTAAKFVPIVEAGAAIG